MTDQQSRKLIGPEITEDLGIQIINLKSRIKALEEILLCSPCKGTGESQMLFGGSWRECPYCHGSGNRLDSFEDKLGELECEL